MYYIGVDLGGTGIKIGLVDENGNIIKKTSCPTRVKDGYKEIVKDMAESINSIAKDEGLALSDIGSIGIGSPGAIDSKNGVVMFAGNLDFEFVPIADEMKKHFNLPVYVGNDANCAALGEYFALKDDSIKDFIAVTLGTGVGGGIILGGKIVSGFNGMAGEIGHMAIVKGGEPCTCGEKGCWEAYASATALIREAEKSAKANPDSYLAKLINENGGKADGIIAFKSAKENDPVGVKVIEDYLECVSVGIVNLVNMFSPQSIVIGGGISHAGDILINTVREYVKKHSFGPSSVKKTDLSLARLGNDAGIIGAAFLHNQF